MDTAPDCCGKDVKPLVHRNYNGADIVLPDDNTQVLRIAEWQSLISDEHFTVDGTMIEAWASVKSFTTTLATGTAERDAALVMAGRRADGRWIASVSRSI